MKLLTILVTLIAILVIVGCSGKPIINPGDSEIDSENVMAEPTVEEAGEELVTEIEEITAEEEEIDESELDDLGLDIFE